MKKLVFLAVLTASMSQAFGAAAFLAGLHDKSIALGGAFTTTTVSVYASPLAGLILFADNGDAYIDLGSEQAVDALFVAVDKSVSGATLNDADTSIISIYAEAKGISEEMMIEEVAAEL